MIMKKRLDVLMYERGLFDSRERAKCTIMEGRVFVDGQRADKPGMSYDENCNLQIKENKISFVSRGGLKLAKAIDVFGIDLKGRISLDAGASTGGFTDCMLQNGCKKVYAVDVGYGQLDWKIRNDDRVVNLERTNIRYITKDIINDNINFFCADLSFISLCKVLPAIRGVINEACDGVCLIKPQFEAGRDKVGKNGVVRDSKVRVETINKIIDFCKEGGFSVKGLDFSPIKGPKGNIEYLLYIEKAEKTQIFGGIDIKDVEKRSSEELSNKE